MTEIAGAPKRRFFFWTAVTMAAIVVLSFPLTYYAPVVTGSKRFDVLLHVHAVAFFAWIGLYVWQTWLVSRGRVAFHRETGLAGFALTGTMLPLGYWMAQRAAELRLAAGTPAPYYGTWFNLLDMTLFAALMLASILLVTRHREWHRRLTYVAALCLVAPAATRWTLKLPVLTPESLDVFSYLVIDIFLVALAVHDRKSLGRVHPASILCIILLLPLQVSAAWVARSEWWSTLAPILIGVR